MYVCIKLGCFLLLISHVYLIIRQARRTLRVEESLFLPCKARVIIIIKNIILALNIHYALYMVSALCSVPYMYYFITLGRFEVITIGMQMRKLRLKEVIQLA